MEKIKLSQNVIEEYEKEIHTRTTDLKIINQLMKMLDYGCFIYSDDFDLEIFRRLKSLFQTHEFFLNAINEFNVHHNIIENENSCIFYFAHGETHRENKNIKIITIKKMETFDNDLEDKLLDIINMAKEETSITLIDRIKLNDFYKKYFKKIHKRFHEEIKEKDLENLEFLSVEYLNLEFKGRLYSFEEDFTWSKILRILDDIKNKKELLSWQVILLNSIIMDTKYIKY